MPPEKRKRGRPIPNDLARRYEAGASVMQLAKHYDCHEITIRRWLKRSGAVMRSRGGRKSAKIPSDLVEQYQSGKSIAKLSRQHAVHRETIRRWLRQSGVEALDRQQVAEVMRKSKRQLLPDILGSERIAAIGEQYRAGSSIASLATRYRVCEKSIKKALVSLGIEIRRHSVMKAGRNPSLSRTQASNICDLFRQGMSTTALAKRYRVTPPTIRRTLASMGIEIRKKGRPKNQPTPPTESAP